MGPFLLIMYEIASLATFAFLAFFNGDSYTWWNWIILIPIDFFLSEIWPIYWLLLRPIFGH